MGFFYEDKIIMNNISAKKCSKKWKKVFFLEKSEKKERKFKDFKPRRRKPPPKF